MRRQQHVYLRRDGVTAQTRGAIEQIYVSTLDAMEQALERHPFVMGDRPTIADIGLFGSMFRHFFCDPTPGAIMRERAPRTLCWVARLWALAPGDYVARPAIQTVPDTLSGLLHLAASIHLPELRAHAEACAEGRPDATFQAFGVRFSVPASRYRAWCLNELRRAFSALGAEARAAVSAHVADLPSIMTLSQAPGPVPFEPPILPIRPAGPGLVRDRNGR
jgi:hypothetical protein